MQRRITRTNKSLIRKWSDVKESGLDVEKVFLISYFEDEKEIEYGIIFTNERTIIQFEIYSEKLSLKDITDLEGIENEFLQIQVAKDYYIKKKWIN